MSNPENQEKLRQARLKWKLNNPNYKKKSPGTPRPESDPLRVRKGNLRRVYGLSWNEFVELHTKQNGICPICTVEIPLDHADTVVDHCHTGGHIRGLLCRKCNMALGLLRDNTDSLQRAITYLGESKFLT